MKKSKRKIKPGSTLTWTVGHDELRPVDGQAREVSSPEPVFTRDMKDRHDLELERVVGSCPSCGSDDLYFQRLNGRKMKGWTVKCPACGLFRKRGKPDKLSALRSWRHRQATLGFRSLGKTHFLNEGQYICINGMEMPGYDAIELRKARIRDEETGRWVRGPGVVYDRETGKPVDLAPWDEP